MIFLNKKDSVPMRQENAAVPLDRNQKVFALV